MIILTEEGCKNYQSDRKPYRGPCSLIFDEKLYFTLKRAVKIRTETGSHIEDCVHNI
jgi:hypothetical protein